MKKLFFRLSSGIIALIAILVLTQTAFSDAVLGSPQTSQSSSNGLPIYRVYNSNTGEHLITAGFSEYDSLIRYSGWKDEGIGWYAPQSGNPVFRLYNPNSGVHFFTAIPYERDSLVNSGWRYESIAFYSGGNVPIYRAYNPNSIYGLHNFTSVQFEQQSLINAGWRDEGTPIYAVAGTPGPDAYVQNWNLVHNNQVILNFAQPMALDYTNYFNIGASKWNALKPGTIRWQSFTDPQFGTQAVQISDYWDTGNHINATTNSNFTMTLNSYYLINADDNYRIDVMTHELGHTLGVGHYPVPGDVMYFMNSEVTNLSPQNATQLNAAVKGWIW